MQAKPQAIDIYASFLTQVEISVSAGRLGRYNNIATQGKLHALKLYIWNANICEAFYMPLKFAEVVTRNAILASIHAQYGKGWYQDTKFTGQLNAFYSKQLSKAIADEKKQHGSSMTDEHVVSGLSFGFWDYLTTKKFDLLLWKNGIGPYFPHAPSGYDREKIHQQIETLRQWRNRVAHYKTVFDKKPIKKMNQALDLVGWVCPGTRTFVAHVSRVTHVVSARPQS